MLFLLLSDFHLADRPPSSCTETYNDDLLALLMQSVQVARERAVAAVVWAGDIFHIKTPGRTSHRLVNQLISLCALYQVPVYAVPGNHDMTNDQIGSLTRQPLGTLLASGAAHMLDGWADPSDTFGVPLYGVPWQQTWDDEHVLAVLRDYTQERSSPALVVAHAPLYPPGRELPYENYPTEQWALAMDGGKGSCFYGHVHEPHGTYRVGGVTFCNNGALSRGSLHEYNLTRPVGCTLWDSETGEFEFVPLAARPASEVFRLTEKQEAVDAAVDTAEFLSRIEATTLGVVSVEKAMEHIRSRQLGPELEALIAELLEEAQ